MLFFQVDFLLLFLVPLLALTIALRAMSYGKALPWIASSASLVFLYAYSALSVAVAISSILLNYFAARSLLVSLSKRVLVAAITANLAILGYFKYSILVDATFFGGSSPFTWRLALPLGVSFYTFQQIAFLCDVYRGKITCFSFRSYMLFKLFFPQFIAGPIVHFERVRASYERWPTFNARSIQFGLLIFTIGMIKKLIGDHFGGVADRGFSAQADLDMYSAWASMLAFTLQIYFDFSGYCDMAVGLARMFGVSLPFNFDSPYKAQSIREFWHRWHITLSRWLRDYLYIPLGGSRYGSAHTAFALFATMALGGLWHGAGWNFLLWGAAHGLALTLTRFASFDAPALIKRACLLAFVALTWVLFRSTTFDGAMQHYASLLDTTSAGLAFSSGPQVRELLAIAGAFCLCLLAPNSQHIALRFVAHRADRLAYLTVPALCCAIFALALAFISAETANAFIYFEF